MISWKIFMQPNFPTICANEYILIVKYVLHHTANILNIIKTS